MKKVFVTTGFGYYMYGGKIAGKYHLPPGEHPIRDGWSIVEVANKQELDAIVVPTQPSSLEEIADGLISQEAGRFARQVAINKLVKLGKLNPALYPTTNEFKIAGL